MSKEKDDSKIIQEYIKKNLKGKKIIMSCEQRDMISSKLSDSTFTHLDKIMNAEGFSVFFDEKLKYEGILWKKK